MAADLPVSVAAGPPPPWPRTWDWNGFYGGINAGFSFGRARDTWNIPTLSVTGEDAEKFSGPLGGIQAGWNWQYSVFLVGFEADIDFGAEKAKQATFNSAFTTPTTIPVQGTVSVTHSGTINWFGTVRGRFGVALGPALFYGTGGLAWAAGKEHVAGTATNAGDGSTAVLIQPSSLNPIMLGWTAGGGAEVAFCNNWTVRAEYLFADLGTTRRGFITQGAFAVQGTTLIPAGSGTVSMRTTDNIVRLGLNYKFAPF